MKQLTLTLAIGAALAAAGPALAQTKILYGSPAPSKGPEARATMKFLDKVEKDAGGKIEFERSFDGQVVQWRTGLNGVKSSLIDATFFVPGFNPSDLKSAFTFTDLAMAPKNSWVRAAAAAETILLDCESCIDELNRFRITPLGFNSSGPFMLMCRSPIASLADLKGKQIRALAAFQNFAQAAGATPVSIAPTEIHEAMQRSQVDCVIGDIGWIKQFGLADVVTHVADIPLGYDHGRYTFAINSNKWKRLPDEQKKAIVTNLPFLTAEATAINLDDAEAVRKEATAGGTKFVDMGKDFAAFVDDFQEKEYARVAKDAGERGVKDPEKLTSAFKSKLDKWAKIYADIGGDRARYEKALWDEIYSKVSLK